MQQPVADREETTIARIAAGDADALSELYAQHRAPLLAYLRLLTRDAGLAEEMLQDTLLAAWAGAERFAVGRATLGVGAALPAIAAVARRLVVPDRANGGVGMSLDGSARNLTDSPLAVDVVTISPANAGETNGPPHRSDDRRPLRWPTM
ncbi:MAG TPA: sigma factor [Thermomicrobiales bacterium]|jgi:RNA polymerase sigma-70 factor (ECF subfamily)|nr:sigma factor [Thermomicrobiales bacterium]